MALPCTLARSEDRAIYHAIPATLSLDIPNTHERAQAHYGDQVIASAIEILRDRMREPGAAMDSPATVRDYLTLQLAELDHEEFGVLLLDARHRVIADERLFRGTLTQTSVYPREVVKVVLAKNAAAVVLYHNHPSGCVDPSAADEFLTRNLKDALALIDVRVLDHLIVGRAEKPMSFAERGLI